MPLTCYLVEKVRYDGQRRRIERVRVHPILGGVTGFAMTWYREKLVAALEGGSDVFVVAPGVPGTGRVLRLSMNEAGCVRVDGEDELADFLGDLPPM